MNKVIAILLCLCMVLPAIAQQLTDSLDVPVEIRSQRSYDDGVVKLSRSHFLSMPGAFDDPSRLLIKYPGISTANDQANSVIYHGLPSQFHQWQLYGGRVLNPNHLSNAGTLSDNPSRSSGGVNMMSGQIIGDMTFYGAPSANSLNSLAGNSDVKLRDPYRNVTNLNISLIGMEAGIDRVWGLDDSRSLMVNYRYSTVGLLTDLGLDFGGEVIKYQDVTAKYSVKTGMRSHLDVYAILGISSNDKDTINPAVEYRDVERVAYEKSSLISGMHHRLDIDSLSTWQTTLNVSRSTENRGSREYLTDLSDFSIYELDETMVSLSSAWEKKVAEGNLGIKLSSTYINSSFDNFRSYNDITALGVFASLQLPQISVSRLESTLVASYARSLNNRSNLVITGGVLHNTRSMLYPVGSLSYDYSLGKSKRIRISYARSAQEVFPETYGQYSPAGAGTPVLTHMLSHNMRGGVTVSGLDVSLFYARYDNMKYTDDGTIYSSLDEIGRQPLIVVYPEFRPSEYPSFEDVSADVYGLDISYKAEWRGIEIAPTFTVMNGQQNTQKGPVGIPNNFGHIANIRLTKKWQLSDRRYLGLGVAAHHRGGANQSTIDTANSLDIGYTVYEPTQSYSMQLSDYWRIDARLYHIIKKGKYKSTVSLDVQNITNRLNDAFFYYEPLTGTAQLRQQLGLLPVLSWRVSF